MEECIFCKIARKEIMAEIVAETLNFIAFLDANPKTKGHTLVIPKKHFSNFIDLPALLGNELSEIIKQVAEKRIKEGNHGFNILMNNFRAAGQVVMHAHVHILPRKEGDGIRIIS